MYYYRLAEIVMQSSIQLKSFAHFSCNPMAADITIERTNEYPPAGVENKSGSIMHRKIAGEWFFHPYWTDSYGLYTDHKYQHLRLYGIKDTVASEEAELLIRVAVECNLAYRGYLTLHSAAVETNREAFAFTGPSGMGKSTRAAAWIRTGHAKLINGDRPLINVNSLELYGVPWDGKEQCFRNVRFPLKAICEVRRSESVYVRAMNFAQRRKLLTRQCFLPMWDTDTAAVQMANITRLATRANIVRIFSGPETESVMAVYNAIQTQQIIEEEPDLKAKQGFVLRNVVDEFILMPTGDNIGKFNGTVLLNEVSAFVWEKLQNPLSKDDLLKAILDEFEVDKATASADLDALLETLRGYGVIEDD